jgi:hypothetical protein
VRHHQHTSLEQSQALQRRQTPQGRTQRGQQAGSGGRFRQGLTAASWPPLSPLTTITTASQSPELPPYLHQRHNTATTSTSSPPAQAPHTT